MPEAPGATDPPLPKGCIPIGWIQLAIQFIFGATEQMIDEKSLRDASEVDLGPAEIGNNGSVCFLQTGNNWNIFAGTPRETGCFPVSLVCCSNDHSVSSNNRSTFLTAMLQSKTECDAEQVSAVHVLHEAQQKCFMRLIMQKLKDFLPGHVLGLCFTKKGMDAIFILVVTCTHAISFVSYCNVMQNSIHYTLSLDMIPLYTLPYFAPKPLLWFKLPDFAVCSIQGVNGKPPSQKLLGRFEEVFRRGCFSQQSKLYGLKSEIIQLIMEHVYKKVPVGWVKKGMEKMRLEGTSTPPCSRHRLSEWC